jgi:adenine-specific DNA-methyltransferase
MENKRNGVYYTPKILSDFLVKHIHENYIYNNQISVLEPSCGDGRFIESISNSKLRDKIKSISLIDISRNELNKALIVAKSIGIQYIEELNIDFLEYQKQTQDKFSLIIGNPPYIKKTYLKDNQIALSQELYDNNGLKNNNVKNIWPSFLLSSLNLLSDDGVLCFVLPGEFLQVNYTEEIRNYLLTQFERIEIYAFNELVFDNTEQDIIVFLGIKKNKNGHKKGISFYQVDKLSDLLIPEYIEKNSNVHRKTLDKWTNYILTDDELTFIDSISRSIPQVIEYCDKIEVGIVTAANDFFIVNKDEVHKFGLDYYCECILRKGSQVNNSLVIDKEVINELDKKNEDIHLISIPAINKSELSSDLIKYIEVGEHNKINQRYKCKKRPYWYSVPSLWKSSAMFVKRTHIMPKIIINEANVCVTDSFYRINTLDEFDINNLAFSFHNSLTMVFAELKGRFYGGGVLELTPNEFKSLKVPYVKKISEQNFQKLESLIQDDSQVANILDFTDPIILMDEMGFSKKDIQRLRLIHRNLVNRRLKKKVL